ncbi:MAG: LysR family transcriptional regulator [Lachnospiraceae bacterium]|nr:LysR family transcriptional regulator [Lachnospiraceae bacterium]
MEFRRIEYFLVLAETLNYAKASKELCISSQALTKQINILEDELGTKLFHRTTRSVQLTEDGEMCKNQFSNLKAQYDATVSAVEKAIKSKNKVVRMSFFAPLPKNELMNPLIHALSEEFEDIEFEITTDNMDGLRDKLKNGELDLVFTNAHDFEDWKGCETITFKTTPAQVIVSSKHPWVKEGKTAITDEDLRNGDILLLIKHGPYEFNSFYAKVKTRSRTLVPNFDSMMIELEKGRKFGVFPMVFNDMQHSGFICFDLPDHYRFNYRTMCGFKTANHNPYAKKVFQYIKKHQKEFVF